MSYSVSDDRSMMKRRSGLRSRVYGIEDFAGNEDGNIAILFGFLALLLFGFIGAAVDYSRYNSVKADMIESLDAAGLAIAQLSAMDDTLTDEQLKEYGRRFFHENFQYEHLIDGIDVDFDITGQTITPSIDGTLKTKMLRVGFFDNFDMTSSTEITKKGSGKVELALVLDVTGSMGDPDDDGDIKIESLRTAVDSLLNVMYGEDNSDPAIKIGIVPFNAYVNPGGASSWSNNWADTGADAYYHGKRFFHVDQNGDVDMDVKVNHFNLFDSVTDGEWMGCVEARPYPLDELDTPPTGGASGTDITSSTNAPAGYSSSSDEFENRIADAFNDAPDFSLSMSELTSSVNTRWVPMFAPDEPDCDANWRGRCPYYHGNSYWTRSETFTANGNSMTINFWRNWFNDPSYNGHSESDYDNRNFIDDDEYIGRYGGEPTGRYAKIAKDFRALDDGGLNSNEQKWKDMLEEYGVDYYQDPHVTSSGDGSTIDQQDEYIMRTAYVGWWDPGTETYKFKYDQNPSIDESISDSDDYMRGPNRDCPAPILPLTDQRTDIEDHMDTLFPNGNTNTANGAVWGWRVLSEQAPFTEGAGDNDNTWQKAVVIMTDGVNTTSNNDTHWDSDLTAYGFAIEERMGDGMDHADDMEDEYDNKLIRICQRMKDEGYLVYTIVFGLNDTTTEKVFKSCASKSTAPYYQKAPSGEDLEDAFGDIAQDLVKLHVSK